MLQYLALIKAQGTLSWDEDYVCFGSNIRESLNNIELTNSIVPESLAGIPTRDVKAAMRWLLLRKTAGGEVACKTPDTATGCNISGVCSVNSEICITDPSKYAAPAALEEIAALTESGQVQDQKDTDCADFNSQNASRDPQGGRRRNLQRTVQRLLCCGRGVRRQAGTQRP